jgi:quinol monooxygenase YgiN
MSITRINHFHAKAGCEEALFNFMSQVVLKIRATTGCISCKLLKSVENSAQLAVIEEWASIEVHKAAASVIPKEQLEEVMAFFAKPPVGTYYSQ